MLQLLKKRLKTNIAQSTKLFDISNKNAILTTENNVLTLDDKTITGEYTISNGNDTNAYTKSCINDTFVFKNGIFTSNEINYGKTIENHNIILHEVNVSSFINRDLVPEYLNNIEDKTKNEVCIYLGEVLNKTEMVDSVSNLCDLETLNTLGVFFCLNVNDDKINYLSPEDYDKFYMNCLFDIRTKTSSLLKFDRVLNRQHLDGFYVVEMQLLYEDNAALDENFKNSLKAFDSFLNIIN